MNRIHRLGKVSCQKIKETLAEYCYEFKPEEKRIGVGKGTLKTPENIERDNDSIGELFGEYKDNGALSKEDDKK